MSNLVESVKGYFSEELVGRLVPFLGVEAEKVQSIVDAGIGALASEIPSFAESGGLATFTGLTTNADFDGKWQPEGGLISLAGQGKSVLDTLLGDRKDDVVAQVAAESGAKGETVEKALCIVSPALMIAAAGMAVEKPVEAPKAPQKKRITVGNLEEVQEAVVATAEAPAPAPLNIPIAEPESPVATTPSVSAAPATAKAPTRLLPAIAAVICTVVLGATVLMKGCGAAPAETQPAAQSTSQPTTQPASAEPKLEDPPFPVSPDVNGTAK